MLLSMGGRFALGAAATMTCALALLVSAPGADAEFGVAKFDAGVCTKNTEPAPECTRDSDPSFWYTQAAGHPQWGITDFEFNTTGPLQTPDGNVKNVRVDLPVGLSVNPEATPKCTTAQLEASACAPASAVGTNYMVAVSGGVRVQISATVYNMVQPDGMPARFGLNVPLVGGQIYLDGGVEWSSDYHEFFTISNITDQVPLVQTRLVFNGRAGDGTFITMPSYCDKTGVTGLKVESHQEPGKWLSYSTETPVKATGCDQLPFRPTASVTPDTKVAGAPAGVTIAVDNPQNPNGKDKPNSATIQDAHVTLPEGMTLNPSAANGLEACTDAQLGKGTRNPVACPAGSAIGTVAIETPVLPAGTLQGTAYLGQPLSGEPTSGDEYRTFLVVDNPHYGVSIRLVGNIVADPETGRLTASFRGNPQIPFSQVRVTLRGGDRAPLVNPPTCGTTHTLGSFLGHHGGSATSSTDLVIDAGCDRANAFGPGLTAAVSSAKAGGSPTFTLGLTRNDGEQQLKRIAVDLPPGLLAKPNGIPLCDDGHAAAGTCPATSRIGSVQVAAGAGNTPFSLGGQVYLTSAYGGGPYGLSIVVPAKAGPFDLGLVVVRAAITLDRNDAHVRVLSDPLPTILDGIPLLLRSVAVTIDRPDTMRTPTSCAPLSITSSLTSIASLTAAPSAPYQSTGCEKLDFTPKTKIALTGAKETVDGKHPGVDATLTQAAGQANIKQMQVTMPLSIALDPENANGLCEFADGLKGNCPEKSVIGTATARTPLLPHELKGKVYFVKGVRVTETGALRATLPTLLVKLKGDVELDIRATTAVDPKTSQLISTFAPIPDAQVSSFHLKLDGGKNGILVVTGNKDICAGAQKAGLVATGHNAKQLKQTVTLSTPCAAAPKLSKVAALPGGRVRVTVKAMANGRLTLSGASKRVGTWSRSLRKGQTKTIILRPSKVARASLAGGKRMTERVVARFSVKGKGRSTVRSGAVRLRR